MGINTIEIINQYDMNLPHYHKLRDVVIYELSRSLKTVKTHAIENRIKEISSFLDKVRRNKINNPFEEIHDIVGIRVVCLFLNDIQYIQRIVDKEFEVFDVDDKVNPNEKEIFGYMSLHMKARLKEASVYEEVLKEIPFEIQVRTIAQDAWAAISHHLDYKKQNAIAQELKRDFHALSGLFYVADTHFSMLKKGQTVLAFGTHDLDGSTEVER